MKNANQYILLLSIIFASMAAYCKESLHPMKILIAAYNFPKVSETFVVNQVTGLLAKGHDVSVYAIHPKPEEIFNEDFYKYNLESHVYYEKLPADLDAYDIIVCQFGMLGNQFLSIKKKHRIKAKLATFFRGFDISQHLHDNPHLYDQLLKQGDLFLTNCDFFKNRLLKLGAAPEKTVVHYSSINCSKFPYCAHPAPKDGAIQIVTVGRLVEKKGIEDALHAMAQVVKRYPKAHYTIIGEGPIQPKLEQMIKKLGLEEQVTFPGWKKPTEIAGYLKDAHIFILPCVTAKNYDQDAIPNVLKEAMACGLPVISTRITGIPEAVKDGKNGFLVPEHDINALAQKIIELIEHPELWEPFGKHGRALVEERFEIGKQSDELERILSAFSR